jgi:hypothetical protein
MSPKCERPSRQLKRKERRETKMPVDDYEEVHHITEYTKSLEIEVNHLRAEIVILNETIDNLRLLLDLKK